MWGAILSRDGDELRARQMSKRGGELVVRHDAASGRVSLKGHAVTTVSGYLRVPAPVDA